MLRRRALAVPLLLVALGGGVTACGSNGGSTTSTSPRLGGAAGSSKEAQDLIARTAAALRKVHSYHADGVSVDRDGRTRLTADVSDDGRLRVTTDQKNGRLSLIVVGRTTYVKGDRAFWLGTAGGSSARQAARVFAGRWVKAPPSFGAPFLKTVRELLPKTFAHCLPEKLGRLTIAGTRTFQGKKVTVVADDGNTPGGTPSELWVAAGGAALPVRSLGHGASRTGGGFDPLCDAPNDTTTRSVYGFGRYDRIAPIRAPKHPLDLGKLRGHTPGGRSV